MPKFHKEDLCQFSAHYLKLIDMLYSKNYFLTSEFSPCGYTAFSLHYTGNEEIALMAPLL